jgi:predicted nucleotidyltransferase
MELSCEEILATLSRVPGFEHVRFVMLYGSRAEGRAGKESDIDLCVYFEGEEEKATRFRVNAMTSLSDTTVDIRIFLQLPLYVRVQVLKGTVVYCPDLTFLYDVAWNTIREYDDFRHRLDDYTGEKAIS